MKDINSYLNEDSKTPKCFGSDDINALTKGKPVGISKPVEGYSISLAKDSGYIQIDNPEVLDLLKKLYKVLNQGNYEGRVVLHAGDYIYKHRRSKSFCIDPYSDTSLNLTINIPVRYNRDV